MGRKTDDKKEKCEICGCQLTSKQDTYGQDTLAGRAHQTKHHNIAKRFYGQQNGRKPIFKKKDRTGNGWNVTRCCFECHEELLHNPILTSKNIKTLSTLVKKTGSGERRKPEDKKRIANRILLFHAVIDTGLEALNRKNKSSLMRAVARGMPKLGLEFLKKRGNK